MSTTPAQYNTEQAMRKSRVYQWEFDHDAIGCIHAAEVAERLIVEAVQAERQRILDGLAAEEWPDHRTGHQALLASVVRSIVEDTP